MYMVLLGKLWATNPLVAKHETKKDTEIHTNVSNFIDFIVWDQDSEGQTPTRIIL